jgi:hemoglobin-like flavoprotein
MCRVLNKNLFTASSLRPVGVSGMLIIINPGWPDRIERYRMFRLLRIAPDKTQRIENSFWKINRDGSAFVSAFYARLFETHPEVVPLFARVDQAKLEVKLLKALTLIVENLRRPGQLVPMLEALGQRHRTQYRVLSPHYAMLHDALLATLKEYSGADWSPELAAAWGEAIDGIS